MATLAALGLRQQGIDLVDNGITLDPEADRGITEDRTEDHGERQYHDNSGKNHSHDFTT